MKNKNKNWVFFQPQKKKKAKEEEKGNKSKEFEKGWQKKFDKKRTNRPWTIVVGETESIFKSRVARPVLFLQLEAEERIPAFAQSAWLHLQMEIAL